MAGTDHRAAWRVSVRSLLRRPLIVCLMVAVALAALGWIGFDSYRSSRNADRRAEAYDQVTQVASDKVLDLTNLQAGNADKASEELMDGVTDDFRAEFAEQVADFTSTLRRQQVTSTGRIVSIAVDSLDDDSASVLVAASGTVTNNRASKPQARYYRLRVDLLDVDGRWLVDGLEFVS
jgi:Mce-associated membrane protein